MESAHHRHPEDVDVHAPIKAIVIAASDSTLVSAGIVKKSQLQPVDLEQVKKLPIKSEDIVQEGIGNCYMLAALAAILDQHPQFLNKILAINKAGQVIVTLHDINDPEKKYHYVMEPTKVVDKNQMNNHKHDAIFLIEKAYAYHRIRTEQLKYVGREALARQLLLENNKDIEIVARKLIEIEHAKKNESALEIKKQITTVLEKFNKFMTGPDHNKMEVYGTDFTEQELALLEKLKESGFNEQVVLENELSKLRYESDYGIKLLVELTFKKMKNDLVDYISALIRGHGSLALTSFVGTSAKEQLLPKEINFRYLLNEFLNMLVAVPLSELGHEELLVINKMFGDIHSNEAKFFLEALKNSHLFLIEKVLTEYDLSKNKPDIHEMLKDYFKNMINWPDNHEELKTKTLEKICNFIDSEVAYKRGTGKYNANQKEIFDLMKVGLKNGNLITVATKPQDQLSRSINSQQSRAKGLVGTHAYHVANCYDRNGIKFVLIRNPWGFYVRDYENKTKVVDSKPLNVLTAVERKQLNEFQLFLKESPRKFPIHDPALSHNFPLGNGYFEVELKDFCHRFARYSITPSPEVEKILSEEKKPSI